jgi:lysylphosphatidylglycerol synthetase-like protein (DUF2156 family)
MASAPEYSLLLGHDSSNATTPCAVSLATYNPNNNKLHASVVYDPIHRLIRSNPIGTRNHSILLAFQLLCSFALVTVYLQLPNGILAGSLCATLVSCLLTAVAVTIYRSNVAYMALHCSIALLNILLALGTIMVATSVFLCALFDLPWQSNDPMARVLITNRDQAFIDSIVASISAVCLMGAMVLWFVLIAKQLCCTASTNARPRELIAIAAMRMNDSSNV